MVNHRDKHDRPKRVPHRKRFSLVGFYNEIAMVAVKHARRRASHFLVRFRYTSSQSRVVSAFKAAMVARSSRSPDGTSTVYCPCRLYPRQSLDRARASAAPTMEPATSVRHWPPETVRSSSRPGAAAAFLGVLPRIAHRYPSLPPQLAATLPTIA
jgi:hypothetical protein